MVLAFVLIHHLMLDFLDVSCMAVPCYYQKKTNYPENCIFNKETADIGWKNPAKNKRNQ